MPVLKSSARLSPARSAARLPALRRVASRRQLGAGVHLLAISGGLPFLAGQNVDLALAPSGPSRSYSLAGGTSDPDLEVLFEVVPGGRLTPGLAALRAGDPLYVGPAFGSFLDDGRPATWIAAGTGVAPFASMVRSGLGAGKVLLHAARSPEGFHFRELFAARLGSRYLPRLSGEGGLLGWLRESELPPDRRYLLCGSPRMVVEVREALIARGVPFGQIQAEIWF